MASYCLAESRCRFRCKILGKTKAVLNETGTHYVINGQKMWITNGGLPNIFIVFAKIDDDKKLTAFIVEKEFPGISIGEERRKWGLKVHQQFKMTLL